MDVQLPYESDSKPSGLAFVLLAIQRGLLPNRFVDERPDDHSALSAFTAALVATIGRLTAEKPTPEYEDLLGGLSDSDMDQLKAWLAELDDAFREAGATADPVVACKRLREVFGPDFPVPEPEDTGKKAVAPAILTSSSSA